MTYWQPTENILINYKNLIEKQYRYQEVFLDFLEKELSIKREDVEEILLFKLGFKLNMEMSERQLSKKGLKIKDNIICPNLSILKGKDLKRKFDRLKFPEINVFRVFELIPNLKNPFTRLSFRDLNNELVIYSNSDLRPYGCRKLKVKDQQEILA